MSETGVRTSPAGLLADFSLEMAGRDVRRLEAAREAIPPGTRINVGFLENEDLGMRLGAAGAIGRFGFVPVPNIAARRLRSERSLREFLAGLQAEGAGESVFVAAGDPAEPLGPYADAISVIGSGVLEEYGVRRVGVAGYPDGHPLIADPVLSSALAAKAAALGERGLAGSVTTQFGFDADLVLTWLADLRARGIGLPVRVAVPGPMAVRRLLSYASSCGVSISEGSAGKYGLSLTDPTGTADPGRFIRALASGYDPRLHGDVKLHFCTFGAIAATSQWASEFRAP
jgi:methylenetetrahydrofolate reductase (NADPH)